MRRQRAGTHGHAAEATCAHKVSVIKRARAPRTPGTRKGFEPLRPLTLLTGFRVLDVRHRLCAQGPDSYPQLSRERGKKTVST